MHLWAATSAPGTDSTAELVGVGPRGYARNVQDGIIRTDHWEKTRYLRIRH